MAITVLPQYESAGGHIGREMGGGLSEGLQQLAQIKMQHVLQRHEERHQLEQKRHEEQHQQEQVGNFLKVAFPMQMKKH